MPGQDTASKRGKTSKKAQEAVSEAALQSSIRQTTAGLNGFPLDLGKIRIALFEIFLTTF